jgi:hypothetical protein
MGLFGRSKEQRDEELATFVYNESQRYTLFFAFPAMLVTLRMWRDEHGARGPSPEPAYYHLRRKDAVTWQTKMSAPSVEAMRRDLQETARGLGDAEKYGGSLLERRKEVEDELANLAKEPEWIPVPDTIAPALETHYQRFLRHWRK